MGSRRVGFSVVTLVIWFWVLMPGGGSASRQRVEGWVPCTRDSQETDKDMVQKIWMNCWLDSSVIKLNENSPEEDLVSDSTKVNQGRRLLTKDEMQKAIDLLPLQMQHSLLDCLGKKNFPFCVYGEEDSPRNWYSEYIEFLFGWHDDSRRLLADRSFQNAAPAPAPGLGSAPSPALGSAPSPDLVSAPAPALGSAPAPGPGPLTNPLNNSPAPSPYLAPASSSAPNDQSSANSPSQIIPPNLDGEGPSAPPNDAPVISFGKHNGDRAMIVALVLTGTGSFLFAALLFYCYFRCCRKKNVSGIAPKDDRPLLTFSLSDFSNGSSQKSFGCADSINKEKTGTLSFKTEPSQNEQVSSLDINSARTAPSGEISGISSSSFDPSISPFIAPAPKPPSPPPLMPPPIKKVVRPPPGPPPPPPNLKPGPCPPLPPKVTVPPRPPQTSSSSGRVPSPLGLNHSRNQKLGADDNNAPKIKLKPFFWDKVLATPDHSMVWHEISSGSFQFNEEMIESLFGYSTDKQKNVDKKDFQYIQILDPKKSQNLAIQLRALNVTREEVCDALMEGNELPTELLQTLLKMAPTTDEELKLRLYAGDLSQLGPGEQFLKALVDIPFAFKRLDALLFMSSLQEDVSTIKESFATFEIACQELRSSRLFLKLLEAVLKTGNRMNDGTYRGGAQAFKLDTLLKLADVKGTDGKTTLLLFVVQEIMRSEGVRAARAVKESRSISSLTVTSAKSEDTIDDSPCEYGDHYRNLGLKAVSGLGDELENVKKAAVLDDNALTNMVGNLGKGLVKTKEFLNKDMMSMEEDSGFHHSLKGFIENVEVDITSLLEEEKRIRSLVKSTSDYFHGNAGKDEGLRLFVIVRDFLVMLDNACKEVRVLTKRAPKMLTNKEEPAIPPVPVPRQWLFPAVKERWVDNSSSDDGSP